MYMNASLIKTLFYSHAVLLILVAVAIASQVSTKVENLLQELPPNSDLEMKILFDYEAWSDQTHGISLHYPPSISTRQRSHMLSGNGQPLYGNPFDGTCETGLTLDVYQDSVLAGSVCTKDCSADADCQISGYDSYTYAISEMVCRNINGGNKCVTQAKEVMVGTHGYHICPNSMTLANQATVYCHFTKKSELSPHFRPLKDDEVASGYWREFAALPDFLSSPFTKEINLHKSYKILTQACISGVNGQFQNLCPPGMFCQLGLCYPNPDNEVCLGLGGRRARVINTDIMTCTFTDNRRFCTQKLEPLTNTAVTALITWLLFFLRMQLAHWDLERLFCKCCCRRCRPTENNADILTPIVEHAHVIVARDMRFRKALNFIRRPFASLVLARTLWSIITVWFATLSNTSCITSFGAFFYVLLNQEISKQSMSNSLILFVSTVTKPRMFGEDVGLADDWIKNDTISARIATIVMKIFLFIAILNLFVFVFSTLVFLWPYSYLVGGIAITSIVLKRFARVLDNSTLHSAVTAFCRDAETLVDCKVSTESVVRPMLYSYSSTTGERRTRSEMIAFAHLFVAKYVFEKYMWSDIHEQHSDDISGIEALRKRAQDAVTIQRLFRRVGKLLKYFVETFERPPVVDPTLLSELAQLLINSLMQNEDKYFIEPAKTLCQEKAGQILQYHETWNIPSLTDDRELQPKTSVEMKEIHSQDFLRTIDKVLALKAFLFSRSPSITLKRACSLDQPSLRDSQAFHFSLTKMKSGVHSSEDVAEDIVTSLYSACTELQDKEVESGASNLSRALEQTIQFNGLSIAFGIRGEIVKEFAENMKISEESYKRYEAMANNKRLLEKITFDLFKAYERLDQGAVQRGMKSGAFYYQLLPWILLMGCNLYFYTNYKDGFNIIHDRVTMKEFYYGYVKFEWFNYFI